MPKQRKKSEKEVSAYSTIPSLLMEAPVSHHCLQLNRCVVFPAVFSFSHSLFIPPSFFSVSLSLSLSPPLHLMWWLSHDMSLWHYFTWFIIILLLYNALFNAQNIQRGTSPAQVIDKSNNCPHILRFVTPPGADLQDTYFIAVEQKILMECRCAAKALYCLLATHYVFDISYNPSAKDVLLFLQEKVTGISDPGFKKSAIYSNISSAIECFLPESEETMWRDHSMLTETLLRWVL